MGTEEEQIKSKIKGKKLMRQSPPPRQPLQENAKKYLCYQEAWNRINSALEQGFFLEAVAIEESIIWDRLASYLRGLDREVEATHSLNSILITWKKTVKEPLIEEVLLQEKVDTWRKHRNFVIHGIVKTHPDTKSEGIDSFLERARRSAEEGRYLAHAVDDWRKKQR